MCSGHVAPWREAVGDRGAHPPASSHLGEQDLALHLLVADDPGATVHVEQHRRSGIRRQVGAPPDVETVPLAELGVGDVAGRPVPASLTEPGQRLLGDGQSGLATDRFGHLVAVAGAERGSERLVQHRRCSPRIDGQTSQIRPTRRARSPARSDPSGSTTHRWTRPIAVPVAWPASASSGASLVGHPAANAAMPPRPRLASGRYAFTVAAAPTALAASSQRSVLTTPSSRPDDERGR